MFRKFSVLALLIALSACSLNDNGDPPSDPAISVGILETEARRDNVFVVAEGTRETLPLNQQVLLATQEGVAVAVEGWAALEVTDVMTGDLLLAGEVILQDYSDPGPSLEINLQQNGGVLYGNFNPARQDNRTLTVNTDALSVTTTAARFIVAREANNLEWVINLGAEDDVLQITAAGVTEAVPQNEARSVAPGSAPRSGLSIDPGRIQLWLDAVRQGSTPGGLGEVLLPPADIFGLAASLTALPRPGQPFELGSSVQGPVKLSLDRTGLFGGPAYALEDCNGDGSQDISVLAGIVHFDFSEVMAQVRALDVDVINRDRAGNGALWTMDAAHNEVTRQLVEAATGEPQTLSLRSEKAYHTGQLAIVDGCFVGFSLTPPTSAGSPAPPRAALTTQQQRSVVVNVLITPESDGGADGRTEERIAQIEAASVDADIIQIDSQVDDWNLIARQQGLSWTQFDMVVYDDACTKRYPGPEGRADLSGQVRFAYDEQFLYVAFQITDDGYAGYRGSNQQYFLGDSPQLSLDMELLSDYDDIERSQDDWQVDFYPGFESPQVALWQLGSLGVRNFEEAAVAVSPTGSGYFLEAALPWRSLNTIPQPGDRLGLAANVNDNDTPNTNVQECIISTAPGWEWNNPTSWGTLYLRPANEE